MNPKHDLFAPNDPEEVSQELSDFANRLIAEENLRLLDGINVNYKHQDTDIRLDYSKETEKIGTAKFRQTQDKIATIAFDVNEPYRGHYARKKYGGVEFQRGQGYGKNLLYVSLSIVEEYSSVKDILGWLEKGKYPEVPSHLMTGIDASRFWKKMGAKFHCLGELLNHPVSVLSGEVFKMNIEEAKRKIKAQL